MQFHLNPLELITGYWTGVGSRETPLDVLAMMTLLAKVLADMGWILRSGGAKGADTAFYEGFKMSENFGTILPEIFLSWNGMKIDDTTRIWENIKVGLLDAKKFSTHSAARDIAMAIHPAWDRCGPGAKLHHTRNVFQVLGADLKSKSSFLFCWAKPKTKNPEDKRVDGGTATAVALAHANGVRVHNLYYPEKWNEVIDFFDYHQVPHQFERKVA